MINDIVQICATCNVATKMFQDAPVTIQNMKRWFWRKRWEKERKHWPENCIGIVDITNISTGNDLNENIGDCEEFVDNRPALVIKRSYYVY